MPTPMPIIAASSWPKVGMAMAWLRRSMIAKEIATPKRAVRIGSPMAMTDPKATSRMITAARRPAPSVEPGCDLMVFSIGAPPSSTSMPAGAPTLARSMTAWTAALGRLSVVLSNRMFA